MIASGTGTAYLYVTPEGAEIAPSLGYFWSDRAFRFNLLAKDGSRLKQQYVSEKDGKVVERADMVKGYEFEKDRFVLFTNEELKALEEAATHVIEIVAFVPEQSVDPIYYDKAYLLAPDKRGGKPYALLAAAMRRSGRCALARWSWKSKQYVVQVRPAEDGLVLQDPFLFTVELLLSAARHRKLYFGRIDLPPSTFDKLITKITRLLNVF